MGGGWAGDCVGGDGAVRANGAANIDCVGFFGIAVLVARIDTHTKGEGNTTNKYTLYNKQNLRFMIHDGRMDTLVGM